MPKIHVQRGFEFKPDTLRFQGGRPWLQQVGERLEQTGTSVKVGRAGAEEQLATAADVVGLYDRAVQDAWAVSDVLGLDHPRDLNAWFQDFAQALDDVAKPTSRTAPGDVIDLSRGSDLARTLGLDRATTPYASATTEFGQVPPEGSVRLSDVVLSRRPALDGGTRPRTPSDGKTELVDRAAFESLARLDNVPGAHGVEEVKFLVDIETNEVFFINTRKHEFHFKFAEQGLGFPGDLRAFNQQTYFTDNRKFIAGSIIAHDSYETNPGQPDNQEGLYTVEFWPTDPVAARHVTTAYNLIKDAAPFADGKLRYHPAGETQRDLFQNDEAELAAAGVESVQTSELFANQTFSALNPGVGFGVLRVIDGTSDRPPSARDVVIFKNIPNDLTRVGGVITTEPQTPLSHVNLKAKQNDTPNAYIKDADTDPDIAPLIGKLVRYEITPDGPKLREATQAEADAYLDAVRPPNPQTTPRDLGPREVTSLADIGTDDLAAYGAKAANLGELQKILPPGMVPEGFGVPVSFYDDFMNHNGLYDEAKAMMADPAFQSDPAVREQRLRSFRRRVRSAEVPTELTTKLEAMQASFPADQPIRCRSSTNNEDLEGFNGAGLYASYTHRPDEGSIINTMKQVWSSLWTLRAFDEREFHRIDHMSAAMGVAVHPNFDDEKANGVAVTKNIYDPNWEGFYVNAQVGEALVTNPDEGATPDELLISAIGPNREWETQYIRRSTLTDGDDHVLTDDQLVQLREAMRAIQSHFRAVYGRQGDRDFAMDIEFKIDDDDNLVIKQARPWVD